MVAVIAATSVPRPIPTSRTKAAREARDGDKVQAKEEETKEDMGRAKAMAKERGRMEKEKVERGYTNLILWGQTHGEQEAPWSHEGRS